jgi:hypothetical protein
VVLAAPLCFGVRQCLNERSSRSNKSLVEVAGEANRSRGGAVESRIVAPAAVISGPIALWNNLNGSGISHGDLQGLRD